MFRLRRMASVFAVALGAMLAATLPAAAQSPVTVNVATSASLGSILTSAKGMTLYYRSSDPAGGSTCTGHCAANWPPLTATGAPTAASGVTGKLTTFTRADGSRQVAYNGHALYTFVGDKAAGDTKGNGLLGIWHVATVGLSAAASGSGAKAATPALPKTGSEPLAYLAGGLLILGGLLLLRRRAQA